MNICMKKIMEEHAVGKLSQEKTNLIKLVMKKFQTGLILRLKKSSQNYLMSVELNYQSTNISPSKVCI